MKNLLTVLTVVFGVTTAHATETQVVCIPTVASVTVNGVLDVAESTKLMNTAQASGEFAPLFEPSQRFRTIQSGAKPHDTWIGIDDSDEFTQYIAVMNFPTMTYTRTAHTKFWNPGDSETKNLAVHSVTSACEKRAVGSDGSGKLISLPKVNILN
tara:strand:+ start:747 stop:1211 length:465 start_codon:yes stop_codon:yes gene_type:complete